MNHEQARSLFMDYLYDEIDADERQRLEHYLEQHPDLYDELEELRATRKLFPQIPPVESGPQLFMVEPKPRSLLQGIKQMNTFAKFVTTMAAALALFLFLGSLYRLHIEVSETGYSVSMGYSPAIYEGINDEQIQLLLTQVQERNAAVVTEYAESTQREYQQQILQLMQYVLQQRESDMQRINDDLDQIQQVNSYRWQQANRLMGDFLESINYQELN